jgi:hypothetical protein
MKLFPFGSALEQGESQAILQTDPDSASTRDVEITPPSNFETASSAATRLLQLDSETLVILKRHESTRASTPSSVVTVIVTVDVDLDGAFASETSEGRVPFTAECTTA